MKSKLWMVLIGVVCVASRAHVAMAKTPRAEFIKAYTKTGGVLALEKFADPPIEARPNTFWPIFNGYFDLEQITRELEEMKDKGMSGGAYWDTGTAFAYGRFERMVPAGPAFMGPESVKAIVHTIKEGTRLGLEIGLDSVSSWCAGGAWVTPADALQVLYHSRTSVEGPRHYSEVLPFPEVGGGRDSIKRLKVCPKGPDGLPVYYKDIAVLALPEREVPAQEFLFDPARGKTYTLDRVVIHNFGGSDGTYYSKDFSILISTTTAEDKAFKEILKGQLKAETGPQTFTFGLVPA